LRSAYINYCDLENRRHKSVVSSIISCK